MEPSMIMVVRRFIMKVWYVKVKPSCHFREPSIERTPRLPGRMIILEVLFEAVAWIELALSPLGRRAT
jgi:hypothetical protein